MIKRLENIERVAPVQISKMNSMRGRIGVARRVHLLEKYDPPAVWATSMCGKWAGAVQITEDAVTCVDCKQARAGANRPFVGEIPEPTGPEETCEKCLLPSMAIHECRRCGARFCADRCGGYAGGSCPGCVNKDLMK